MDASPSPLDQAQRDLLLSKIRDIPDWPQPGVTFKDITPLLGDATAFATAIEGLAAAGRDDQGRPTVDSVVGIEARGFILAAPVAHILRASFVPARKAGKLPYKTAAVSYQLEYGEETIEVHEDAFRPGARVLVIDDVLATGGTVEATAKLVSVAGGQLVAVSVLMALGFLRGRERVGNLDVRVLLDV
ncbi:MAG: adenine phosphoribosyltransferase [Actinomycetota bacterium]